jgi:hypothetical protein
MLQRSFDISDITAIYTSLRCDISDITAIYTSPPPHIIRKSFLSMTSS